MTKNRGTVSVCLLLIGIGHIAALQFELYRLVPISIVIATILAALHTSKNRPQLYFSEILTGLIIALPIYLYAVISSTWSPDVDLAFRDATYMCIAVVPSIVFGIVIAKRFSLLDIAFGFGMLLLPFLAQSIVNEYLRDDPMIFEAASMRSILASILCLIAPILSGAWLVTRQTRFLFFVLVVCVLALTMGSRSALLIIFPTILVSIYLKDKQLAILGFLLTSLLLIIVFLVQSETLSRFSPEGTDFNVGESVLEELQLPPEERVDFDRRLAVFTSIDLFLAHPIIGGGYSSVRQTHQANYGYDLAAHGLIPGSLSELGLFGIFIFLFVVMQVIARARVVRYADIFHNHDQMVRYYLLGLAATMVVGMFHQIIESVFFGLILGILIGCGQSSRANNSRIIG